MKKLKFYALILSALLVSSGVWGNVEPEILVPPVQGESSMYSGIRYSESSTSSQFLDNSQSFSFMKGKRMISPRKATKGNVAKIIETDTEYGTLAGALTDVQPGQTIQLIDHIWDEPAVITKNITLDLNGYILRSWHTAAVVEIDNNAQVLITSTYTQDWGYILTYSWNYYNNEGSSAGNAMGVNVKSGKLTLDGSVCVSSYQRIYKSSYGPAYGIKVQANATLEIKGNYVWCISYYAAVKTYSVEDIGFGTANIQGGTFISQADNAASNAGEMNIEGGDFQTSSSNIWAVYSYGTLVVTGGIFKNGIIDYATFEAKGGTYGEKLSGCHSPVPYAGYDYEENQDGTVTIKQIKANIVGDSKNYFSVQSAIDAAKDNDEISLYINVEENVTVGGKTITFNPNGKKLTGNITATEGGLVNIISNPVGTVKGQLIKNGGDIKVYFGQFTQDPSACVPVEEGCVSEYDSKTELYIVKQEVAQINGAGEKYNSIKGAIAAANLMSGEIEVKLLNNACLDIFNIPVNVDMTINLNGKTLYAANSGDSYLRLGTAGTKVTIKNGTITNSSTASTFPEEIVVQAQANELTLEDVTIANSGNAATAIITNAGAKLTVKSSCTLSGHNYDVLMNANGTLDNSQSALKVCVGNNAATLINAAECTMSLTTTTANTETITLDNAGTFDVVGGTYKTTVFDGSQNFQISGGIFYDTIQSGLKNKLISSKKWNKISRYNVGSKENELVWEVLDASSEAVAEVDGLSYYTLEDAINAVGTVEKTITLVSDIHVNVSKEAQYVIPAGKIITLDLQGKRIEATNTSKGGVAVVFKVDAGGTLVVDDLSEDKNGIITYDKTCIDGGNEYTIWCKGTFTLKNGTIENASKVGTVPYAIEIDEGGIVNIEGGLVYSKYNFAIRYQAHMVLHTVLNVSGGEIKGTRAIWIQLASNDPNESPFAEFNMTGGTLTSTNENENVAFYVYTHGNSLDNIRINVSCDDTNPNHKKHTTINGRFLIGGGSYNGGNYNERTTITGGTFFTSNAFKSFRPGAEHRCLDGGAYFFSSTTTKNDYIMFCDYVKNGHYVVKMCQDDSIQGIEGKDYLKIFGHKYVEDICDDGSYWAVIDGMGSRDSMVIKVDTISPEQDRRNLWDDDPTRGIFSSGNKPDILTDVKLNDGEVLILKPTQATANRLVLEQGAGIRIKSGASLEVGTGGLEVNSTGKTCYVIVEAGGKLIANGTVISQDVSEIKVFANETGTGTILLEPNVSYNNQPKATVGMYTYARYIPEQEKYIWQHFGIPTKKAPTSITNDKNCATQYWQWNYEMSDWEQVNYKVDSAVNTSFRGYNLVTNYTGTNGVIYTFTGQIMGNKDAEFNLVNGFNFYANSYLAPIDIEELISEVKEAGDDVEWTVWMYDGKVDNFLLSNELTRITNPELKTIPALRGFFLKLSYGEGSATGVNYEKAVWGPSTTKKASAPAIKKLSDMTTAVINMTSLSNMSDQVMIAEDNQFTAQFDNGFDASKLMSERSANLYAETMNGNLAVVASDDINGLYLTIATKDETTYTMTFSNVNGETMTLVDHQTNARIQMVEGGTYSFTAPANTTSSNRFQIVKAPQVVTGMENLEAQDNAKSIYTVFGQYVGQVNDWAILPVGVYVVNGEKVVK